jgi:hypothetical protein
MSGRRRIAQYWQNRVLRDAAGESCVTKQDETRIRPER